ncbi:2-dehydro-3-deoxygalactonokinase [Mucilaginibacter gotjawali]|uniref:2-keto-3-deoxy-galactonokinase n=2 Tax=Mucilaginibacter gotjawali TaxID=1550579 RepID=A0A120MXN0_9SPHI|nr:2-dehydro-3-deoxygalactonokinase [Mucilaginibacter gotjawali]MBB3056072.1 2-dehydro-3-deoxygalactonokinase [Mucilaginibacter gotjawali]BAU53591.1 2-keto-3-deoxy-galactonokinase [Mucilaginibacter gotjawali]
MKYFLSCDWGTTSFRIKLARTNDGRVVAEESSADGIARIFERWQQTGQPEEKRSDFYLGLVNLHAKRMEEKANQSLSGVPLLISGMASSSVGFIDIPYNSVPFSVDGAGIQTAFIAATKAFDHNIWVVSGLKTTDDVMRGEETQLIGCIEPGQIVVNEMFIFPGTHSKHILVKNNRVVDFKTYMTGEVFALLCQNSILKNGVERGHTPEGNTELESFKAGVKEAVSSNLLHSIFKARTNQLFEVYQKSENYNYLSGLLIGAELRDLVDCEAETINLVCGQESGIYYQSALLALFPSKKIKIISHQLANGATVMGHLKIAKQLKIFA